MPCSNLGIRSAGSYRKAGLAFERTIASPLAALVLKYQSRNLGDMEETRNNGEEWTLTEKSSLL